MGNHLGNCCFKCGYTLYAETCVGRCLHKRYVKSFKKHYGEFAVHSQLTPFTFNQLMILPIPLLTTNYAYMVADLSCNSFVLIDVGDASLIQTLLSEPAAILTTHKHWDHSGGNRAMRACFPNLQIYGGHRDHVPDRTHDVEDGDTLTFGRLQFTAISTPGHTRGHVVWRLHGDKFSTVDSLFTGDHLMLGGCGACFEGPITQMISSLNKLKQLPKDSLVWPGHEAAMDNIQLAAFMEPNNDTAFNKLLWVASQRENMLCTCPSTLDEELKYNPFMRTEDETFWKVLGIADIIKEKSLTPEVIGPLCFDAIMLRSAALKKWKQEHLKKQKASSEDPAKSTSNEGEANGTSSKDPAKSTSNEGEANETFTEDPAKGISNKDKAKGTSNEGKTKGTSSKDKLKGILSKDPDRRDGQDGIRLTPS